MGRALAATATASIATLRALSTTDNLTRWTAFRISCGTQGLCSLKQMSKTYFTIRAITPVTVTTQTVCCAVPVMWMLYRCLCLWRGKIGVIYYAYIEKPPGVEVIKR
eukprot:COSAG02_NODE_2441_length_8858_cov_31.570271_7_plen_107_part_00